MRSTTKQKMMRGEICRKIFIITIITHIASHTFERKMRVEIHCAEWDCANTVSIIECPKQKPSYSINYLRTHASQNIRQHLTYINTMCLF
jgi:hypothetical protein